MEAPSENMFCEAEEIVDVSRYLFIVKKLHIY